MFEKIKEIIVDHTGCDESAVTLETSLKDDLSMDSLDMFEIIMGLEEEYGIEIPSEEIMDLRTVEQVMGYLKKKVA